MAQPGYDAAPGGVPRLPTASKSAFSSPLVGFLVSFSSDPHGQPWPIRYGRTSIGSDPGSEVFLPFPGISTRHAEVMVRDNQGSPKIWVSDCNSTNGTKLDGADIFTDRPDLYHGAIITVSGIDLLFISIQ
jgi:pSer/pThr/pTyr-binding forkhead associated (FHA) protein